MQTKGVYRVFILCIMALSACRAGAAGIYDGVWLGSETVTVPGQGINETGQSFTIIYQDGPDSLQVARQDFQNLDAITPMQLTRQGGSWVLPAPVTEVVFGAEIEISALSLQFTTATHMLGNYNFSITIGGDVYPGTGTLSQNKQSCPTLNPSTPVANLSGLEGSLRCYSFQLPACATNFSVTTRNGLGDADLHVAYGKPDFQIYSSQNANNNETLLPAAAVGLWYIGVEGFEDYSGLTLQAAYLFPDADGDGVGDCADSCPATPANSIVDAKGCSAAQLNDRGVISVMMMINTLLLKDEEE